MKRYYALIYCKCKNSDNNAVFSLNEPLSCSIQWVLWDFAYNWVLRNAYFTNTSSEVIKEKAMNCKKNLTNSALLSKRSYINSLEIKEIIPIVCEASMSPIDFEHMIRNNSSTIIDDLNLCRK